MRSRTERAPGNRHHGNGDSERASSSLSSDLSVLFVLRSFGFPHGTASTSRIRLIAKGLVRRGARVKVLCTQVTEMPGAVTNPMPRGSFDGIEFAYSTGTTVRPKRFLVRRLVEWRGLVTAAAVLWKARSETPRPCVVLSLGGLRLGPAEAFLQAWARCIGLAGVLEINERPWVARPDRSPLERLVRPTLLTEGAIVISSAIEEGLRREAGRHRKRYALLRVPILVDMDEALTVPETRLTPAVLLAATAAHRKTFHFVLEAMEIVWRRRPDVTLFVTAGVRPPEGRPSGKVVYTGMLDRRSLLAMYRRVDALLIPLFDDDRSWCRFPTKIGEYLASATPVVSTDVGEVSRYLKDQETAFLSPSPTAEAFAATMLRCLADDRTATAVGRRGRELAARAFAYDEHGDSIHQFLAHVAQDA